ncbi:MAG: hypothetical protein FP831_03930 [Anaerolineae bacterium]|nr:hypothetical protein [Anaerolineae bacterium]
MHSAPGGFTKRCWADDITLYMLPVPRTRTDFPKYWWTEASSRQRGWNEYVKLGYYLFRYQISTGDFCSWSS